MNVERRYVNILLKCIDEALWAEADRDVEKYTEEEYGLIREFEEKLKEHSKKEENK